jgi:hypothetical protein
MKAHRLDRRGFPDGVWLSGADNFTAAVRAGGEARASDGERGGS